MNDELQSMINSFLSRSSGENSDSVCEADMNLLQSIIINLIQSRWGVRCGEYPVSFRLCENEKERFIYPTTLPYLKEDVSNLPEVVRTCATGASALARQATYATDLLIDYQEKLAKENAQLREEKASMAFRAEMNKLL